MSFSPNQLHVITTVTNPARYKVRYALYQQFKKEVEAAGVHLVTAEAAFGEREHGVTYPDSPDHIRLRTSTELWHKENMINLAAQWLPDDWEYVAWVDADITFTRTDWAVETIHQLQHFHVVQMFQTAVDLGPTEQAFQTYNGFGYSFAEGLPKFLTSKDAYYGGSNIKGKFWHPGYAWAMRRDAWDHLGGLIDTAILGAADHHMALSLIGEGKRSMPQGLHPNYGLLINTWQDRAEAHIKRNVGYVPGTILHHWHGQKKNRRYIDRWDIIKKHQFDPLVDIKRDYQGLWQLSEPGLRMRHDLRQYFRSRNEDSIDFDPSLV